MCMSSPEAPVIMAPPPPPPLPELPEEKEPPKKSDEAVKRAYSEASKKNRNLAGDRSTILTGPRGLMAPIKTGTTLLGG